MVNHEFGGYQRIDFRAIAVKPLGRIPHGRQIHNRRHAREVLKQHPCRHERHLAGGFAGLPPQGHFLDIPGGDQNAVFMPQQVFQKDSNAVRKPVDTRKAGLFQQAQAVAG